MAVAARAPHLYSGKSGAVKLLRLLCGEQGLLQRYMQVISAKEAQMLVSTHESLCRLALCCLRRRPSLFPCISTPAFTYLLLDMTAGACQYFYEQRSQQQQNMAGSSSRGGDDAYASGRLPAMQLPADHKLGCGQMRSGDAGKVVSGYAAGMKCIINLASSSSSNLVIGGSSSTVVIGTSSNMGIGSSSSNVVIGSSKGDLSNNFLLQPLEVLAAQLRHGKPSGDGSSQDNHPAATAAAMQLILEVFALLVGAAVTNTALELLTDLAARASREQRCLFISNRGQLLLEVLWLAALDRYTYQQQHSQQEQQRLRQHRCSQQAEQENVKSKRMELICQLVQAGKEGSKLSTQGNRC